MNKDEMIRAQAQDKIEQCFNKNFLTNTQFLDSHQQSILRRMTSRQNPGCNVIFFGIPITAVKDHITSGVLP